MSSLVQAKRRSITFMPWAVASLAYALGCSVLAVLRLVLGSLGVGACPVLGPVLLALGPLVPLVSRCLGLSLALPLSCPGPLDSF